MEDKRIKGTYITSTAGFIEREFGLAQQDQIRAKLSPEARTLLVTAKALEWYPLQFPTEILRAIYTMFDDPVTGGVVIQRCGKSIAQDATTTFLKLLTKILTPKIFALKFPDFWARYHNFGPCRIDLSHIDSNRLIIHVPGYDYLHFVGAGWIESIFLSLGKKDIHVRNNCPVGQACVPEVRWDATWH